MVVTARSEKLKSNDLPCNMKNNILIWNLGTKLYPTQIYVQINNSISYLLEKYLKKNPQLILEI